MRLQLSIITALFICLLSLPAYSQVVWEEEMSRASEETSLARPLALGEAYTAIAEGIGALVYNPAGMSSKVHYEIGIASQFRPTGGAMSFTGAIVDSVTSPVSAGIMYTFQQYDAKQFWNDEDLAWLGLHPIYTEQAKEVTTNYDSTNENEATGYRKMFSQLKDGLIQRHVARLALGGSITPNVHIGLLGKYLYATRPMRHDVNVGNVDAGMLFTTDIGLRFGIVGQNLIHTSYNNLPLRVVGAIGFSLTDELYIDYDQVIVFDVYDERTPDDEQYIYKHKKAELAYRFGIEYIVLKATAIRAGYQYDDTTEQHYVSGGFAYIHEAFSISASYKQAMPHYNDRTIGLAVDFKL